MLNLETRISRQYIDLRILFDLNSTNRWKRFGESSALQKVNSDFTPVAKDRTLEGDTSYLWSRSKCWMRALKRTFNTPRLKSQIRRLPLPEFVR